MATTTRVKAELSGDICAITTLITHPMETGLRKDSEGKLVPAHFIQTINIALNGKTVMDGECGQSVGRNPFFKLKVKGAKVGDKVTVSWADNKGEKQSGEAVVAAKS